MFYDPKLYTYSKDSNRDLEDCTELFIERIRQYAGKEGFGGIGWIIGQVGAGKSALLCTLIDLFLNHGYELRNVALYQAPSNLLNTIQKAVPGFLKNKFRIVERLSEVQPYDIFALDEGYLTANAMNYLKQNEQNFINSLVTLRHSGVVSILGSQDDGILRKYRTKAQFKFYKSLTDGYIEETPKDKFAKKHHELLTTLKPRYTLFRISHTWFTTRYPILRTGILDMPLKNYCPWFNDDISRNFEGESFDALLRRTRKIKLRAEKVIRLLASKFGKKITIGVAKGYLWDNHEKLYLEFKDEIPNLVNTIKSRFKLNQIEKLKYGGDDPDSDPDPDLSSGSVADPDKSSQEDRILNAARSIRIPECNKQLSFPDFLLQFYKLNLNVHKDVLQNEYEALIIFDWANGLSQADIRANRGGSPNNVNKIVKKYRSGVDLKNDQLRVCYALEHYVAEITHGIRQGGNSEPDIIYFENMNPLGPGEVKIVQTNSNKIKFYIYSRNPNHHTLNPSFKFCLEHNIPSFPLFYYWPKWGQKVMLIPIELPDPLNIDKDYTMIVDRKDYDEYMLNFETFNKFTYFYAPR